MAWHGYVLLELAAAITPTVARRRDIERELRRLVTSMERIERAGAWPPYLMQARWREDGRAVLVEGNFNSTSREAFVNEIARALGVNAGQVTAHVSFTVFGRIEGDWDESRAAALAYLGEHLDEWGLSRSIRVPPV